MNYFINKQYIESIVRINADGSMSGIPIDAGNVDYLEYVKWLFDGNTAEEWQPDMEEGN
jgi:hypothetical protein